MRAQFKAQLDIYPTIEVADSPHIDTTQNTVLLNALTVSEQLTADTTPGLEGEPIDLTHTLAGVTDDIDLTAAPIATRIGDTVDLTGKRLIAMLLNAPTTNTGTITVRTATANGYPLGTILLYPGETCLIGKPTGGVTTRAAVAAGARYLTVDGTDTEDVSILSVWGDT